jgi:hypothetical protein
MRALQVVAVGLGLVAAPPLAAQDSLPPESIVTEPIPAGTRIRLQFADALVEQGHLARPLELRAGVVTYCRWPAPACPVPDSSRVVRRPLADVVHLDLRTGQRTLRGALVGGAIALGTISLFAVAYNDADAPGPRGTELVISLAGFTAAGAAIGALVGSARGEWVRLW